MSKLAYMVRHQKAGVLHEYVFEKEPTQEQIDALVGYARRRHRAPGWVKVVTVQLIGDELPEVPDEPVGTTGPPEAGTTPISVSGTGHVKNP